MRPFRNSTIVRPVGVGAVSRFADGKRRVHEHDRQARRARPQHLVLGEVLRALVVPEEVLEVDERVLGREAAVLGDADRADRARVDEPRGSPRSSRGAHHVHRAADVDVVEEVGVGAPRTGTRRRGGTPSTRRRRPRSSVAGSRMSPTIRSTARPARLSSLRPGSTSARTR